jgi:CheY-like chemotaxis protein
MNLVSNARDAMPTGGILSISTDIVEMDTEYIKAHGYGKAGKYTLITVSDTGAGMDERTRDRIFEPFFTTKEVGKGTGLGLSIVYGIIKQHNGYINVYSEHGKGTTFRIYLPLIESEAKRKKPQIYANQKDGTETVLIAEDEEEVRNLMKMVLEGHGYKVIEAVDGADAVDKFKENMDNTHLLLFDVIMPNKSGKEAYDAINEIRPGIKAIFMSGYSRDIIQEDISRLGLHFISKPILPTELLKKVREALDT